jgi:DNA-binding beta-propeller fold protein YncE
MRYVPNKADFEAREKHHHFQMNIRPKLYICRRTLCGLVAALLLLPAVSYAQLPDMVGPLRLAETPVGLAVGDYVGRQVLFLDPATLEITDAFPIYTDETMLEGGKPLSVGWMNGRLYVGEERTGLIQVFEKSGKGKNSNWVLVSASLLPAPVVQPSAIEADVFMGLLFVASKGEKAILIVDEAGNEVRTIGGLGNPQAIALDRAGQRIFVSDDGVEDCNWLGCSMSSVIQVYDYNGQLLSTISGNTGNAGYKFSRAQGVALDGFGRLFMADSYRHEILVFTETSPNIFNASGILGGKGAAIGQLLLPTGVMIEATSDRKMKKKVGATRVLVANTMLARIEALTLEAPVQ